MSQPRWRQTQKVCPRCGKLLVYYPSSDHFICGCGFMVDANTEAARHLDTIRYPDRLYPWRTWCACGCGVEVVNLPYKPGRPKQYATPACRSRAYRARQRKRKHGDQSDDPVEPPPRRVEVTIF